MRKSMTLDELKHAQRERLIFLDRCFTWRGTANRRDLIKRFGISTAQAALDFRAYLDLARNARPTYDSTRKTYIVAKQHVPLIPSSLTDTVEILLDEAKDALSSVLPKPERKVDSNIIALLHQAIRSGKSLHVRYTSMTTGGSDGQLLAPTRFFSDGERIFLRAFSFRHGEYRNYLPIRIELDSSFEGKPLSELLPEDVDWNTRAIIWLRPKSELSKPQAGVVRREYGFEREFLRVETRKALEFFFNQRWGLSQEGARLERAKTEYEVMGQVPETESNILP